MAGRFGGLSVPLRRAARKFNRWLAVSAAKSLGLPPQRVGAHRAAFIRAHLDPDPLPHLLPLALLMLAQVARVAGQSCHCQPHTGLNFKASFAPFSTISVMVRQEKLARSNR